MKSVSMKLRGVSLAAHVVDWPRNSRVPPHETVNALHSNRLSNYWEVTSSFINLSGSAPSNDRLIDRLVDELTRCLTSGVIDHSFKCLIQSTTDRPTLINTVSFFLW
jgi:hypothetical protein